MKTFSLILSCFFITLICNGQERKPDVIQKINGENLTVFVINISEYDVTYSYPNEQFTYTVTKNIIKEINFGSGRTEKITEPVIVSGESDWGKVILTSIPSEIKGLKTTGDVLAKGSPGFGGMKTAESVDKGIEESLKKQAAKMKAHIILVETKTVQANGVIVVTGKAYSY